MFMNRITLVGFAGADAKQIATQGGKEITRFSLATTKRYKSGNEWKDNMQRHDCVVYGTSVRAAETTIRFRRPCGGSGPGRAANND